MKYIIDIPEIPKNDKHRWVVANGTPYEERPHGEWVEQSDNYGDPYYECSVCEDAFITMEGTPKENHYNFCPNCGADMRVKDELNRVSKELNSEIEKSKSEIVPDYRDGWRLKEGEAE